MKKSKLSLTRIAQNGFFAAFVGFLFTLFVPISAGAVAVGVFAVGTGAQIVAPYIQNGYAQFNPMLFMAIQTEVWVSDIEENLFFANEFINLAVDHSSYISNLTVHVPQAGSNPSVKINRVDDESAVTRRTDTDLTYQLKNFTTDPVLIKDIEQLQVSYSKRQSVLGQHIAVLNDAMGLRTLYSWAVSGAGAAIVITTGAATAELLHATATGTRLLLTKMDFASAALKMDIQKAPKAGRFAIVPSCMFYGLFTDSELLKIRAIVGEDMLKMGVVGELFGFNIIVRGEVVRYNAATPRVIKALPDTSIPLDAATDCAGAVCFSRYMVSQAKGSPMVYINEKLAKSYGDVLSAEVNQAAAIIRSDKAGVVCIVQGYVAP